MQATSKPRSWKRVIGLDESDEPSDSADTQHSRQDDEHTESKRTRVIDQDTNATWTGNPSMVPDPSAPPPLISGHTYGPSAVSDNGRLQNGDSCYHAGAASQIFGPGVLNGEMRIHLSNVFHTHNYELREHSSGDPQAKALKSLLYYTTMDDRKAQLSNVEPASFEWIWKETGFSQWLSGPEGIFWISGKPASGKSTLINHLVSDYGATEKVMKHLKQSGKDWLLIKFFFDFRAGTGIANTTLGMLRSLLLQLVEKSPTAKDFVMERCQHRLEGRWPELEAELLELLCGAVKSMSQSICAFVDGLDEYKGSLWKLIDYLFLIQQRSGIKYCLASRPESELLPKLRGVPSFLMQDHNSATINAYIEAALADIGHFVPIQELQIVLKEEVIEQANGVLLWAVFAVNEGVKAALHGCTAIEMRVHVRSFPQELSSVYRRIWDRLNEDDQRLAAITIFVIEHWDAQISDFVRLTSRILAPLCRWIVRKLDPSFMIEPGYTELHFRLKMHAMLGGLVEFGQLHEPVRLAHKSVQTFLSQLPEYTLWADRVLQHVDVKLLGPAFFLHAILETRDAFVPGPIFLPGRWAQLRYKASYIPTVEAHKWMQRRILKLEKQKPLDMTGDMIICALEASASFQYIFRSVESQLINSIVEASECWFMKEYAILISIAANGKEVGNIYNQIIFAFSNASPYQNPRALSSELLIRQPHILFLALSSLALAFQAVTKDGHILSNDDSALLFRILLVRGIDLASTVPKILATTILQKLPWQARFLFTSMNSWHLRVGEEHITREETECDGDFFVRPCLWWPYSAANLLYFWVMTTTAMIPDSILAANLDFLLQAGQSINVDICEDGNALHALLSWDAWYDQSRHIREFPRDLGNNRRLAKKYSLLMERGADIYIRGKSGTLRDAATKYLDRMDSYSIPQIEGEYVGMHDYYEGRDVSDIKEILADIERRLRLAETRIDVCESESQDRSVYKHWDNLEILQNLP